MALETKLRRMAKHIVRYLEAGKAGISIEGGTGQQAFAICKYGEPKSISTWPYCSVQPFDMTRTRKGTRKNELVFTIDIVVYHGLIADTLSIQEGTHQRIEAIDDWFMRDRKWNFVDTDDITLHKIIDGFAVLLDHPVVIAPDKELWSASRLRLRGVSEEVF